MAPLRREREINTKSICCSSLEVFIRFHDGKAVEYKGGNFTVNVKNAKHMAVDITCRGESILLCDLRKSLNLALVITIFIVNVVNLLFIPSQGVRQRFTLIFTKIKITIKSIESA